MVENVIQIKSGIMMNVNVSDLDLDNILIDEKSSENTLVLILSLYI